MQPSQASGRAPTAGTAGTLFLVPNALDFGVAAPAIDLREVLPLGVLRIAAGLGHWIAENARSTRAFLKRVDAAVALTMPLQAISIVELPRPAKGPDPAATTPMARLLEPALRGHDVGLISEAGLPAVADPGTALVQSAHQLGVKVVALPGASALLLAVAASGLNGQSFAFVGYVPVQATERAERIHALEALSRRSRQTQMMIETPYRNAALLAALLDHLRPDTRLSVSCGLTLKGGFTRSDTVAAWRATTPALPVDVPAVFCLLAS